MTQGELGGRPLKFKTVEELQKKISEYFLACDSRKKKVITKTGDVVEIPNPRPYTVTGLAIELDTTRETILDYQSGKYDDKDKSVEENKTFSDTIKRAKLIIENYAEESLWSTTPAGVIFNLKNNWEWEDKKIIETPTSQSLSEEQLKKIDDNLSKQMVANS